MKENLWNVFWVILIVGSLVIFHEMIVESRVSDKCSELGTLLSKSPEYRISNSAKLICDSLGVYIKQEPVENL